MISVKSSSRGARPGLMMTIVTIVRLSIRMPALVSLGGPLKVTFTAHNFDLDRSRMMGDVVKCRPSEIVLFLPSELPGQIELIA